MRLLGWVCLVALQTISSKSDPEVTEGEEAFDEQKFHSGHTNNWAVLVCTSAFWFNYRHVANVLSVYRSAKKLGIPDDHIILMLADDMACNGRNSYQGQVFGNLDKALNLYGTDIEVDYRGCEVTVEMFIRLLTNRLPDHFPKSKRLLTDAGSNILVFMTGHGGDNFLKFQDSEEINAYDIADAFEQMYAMNRYNEILFIIDTCQASTMYERFKSPGIMAISSSMRGESSYSYHVDDDIGVAIIDRFTHSLLAFLEDISMHSRKTVGDFMDSLNFSFLGSKPEIRENLFNRRAKNVKLIDFFGNVQPVVLGGQPLLRAEGGLLGAGAARRAAAEDDAKDEEEPAAPINFSSFNLAGKVAGWQPGALTTGILSTVALGLLAVSCIL